VFSVSQYKILNGPYDKSTMHKNQSDMHAINSDGTQDTSLRVAKDRARRRGYRVGSL